LLVLFCCARLAFATCAEMRSAIRATVVLASAIVLAAAGGHDKEVANTKVSTSNLLPAKVVKKVQRVNATSSMVPEKEATSSTAKPVQGDGCTCKCSWVSEEHKNTMCSTDGDHSCCWRTCCTTSTSSVTSTTATMTTHTTTTDTTTTATSTTATETTTRTTIETKTTTSTETQTSTSTDTSTATSTETTSTTTTVTTTPYCFEGDVAYEPLDMPDAGLPSQADDAWACQDRCQSTTGCMHFTFHKATGLCHLQDAFAQRRTMQYTHVGFVSGPFRCPSYLESGKYTKVQENSYLPKKFHCMQPGVSWAPDMAFLKYFDGTREHVLENCKTLCDDTNGCMHFTVTFPNSCRLAGFGAIATEGIALAMSGPSSMLGCDEVATDAGEESVFIMMKDDVVSGPLAEARRPSFSALPFVAGAAVLGAISAVAATWRHRGPAREACLLHDLDLEDRAAAAILVE